MKPESKQQMKNITNELKNLDDILIYIGYETNHSILDEDFKKSNLYDIEKLLYLEKEGLISKSSIPISYRLTQKGIVFILSGGFENETKREKVDRRTNLINLISSPIIAFISLLLSLAALYYSISANQDMKDKVLNFSNEIKLTFPQPRDTIIIYKEKIKNSNSNLEKSTK